MVSQQQLPFITITSETIYHLGTKKSVVTGPTTNPVYEEIRTWLLMEYKISKQIEQIKASESPVFSFISFPPHL